jgi:hypothetical protein
MLVGAVGIEPTTFGLKGRCSTTELRPWRFTQSQRLSGILTAPLPHSQEKPAKQAYSLGKVTVPNRSILSAERPRAKRNRTCPVMPGRFKANPNPISK